MKLNSHISGLLLGLAALVVAGLAGTHVTHLVEDASARHAGEVGFLAAGALGIWRLSLRQENPRAAEETLE
jgi:hypothetical protein